MSRISELAQRIAETQEIVRQTESLLAQSGNDETLLLSMRSLEKRARDLEEDFLAAAHKEHQDVCSYRIFSETATTFPLLSIGKAFSDFQRWFSTVYDALKAGPKRRARIAPDHMQDSTLNFAFTFSGSVGVAMTIPSERMLIDNELQETMHKTAEMLRAESSDQVHHFAKTLGPAAIRSLYNWVKDHVEPGCGAEIKWLRDDKELSSVCVSQQHLVNLKQAIDETSDEEETVLEVRGLLVGADTRNHTFHMVFDEAEEIRGAMAKNIGEEITVELPREYMARIRKSSFINFATDQETVSYYLLELN